MKKVLSICLVLVAFLLIPFTVNAEGKKITIYLIRGEGCPHCEEAMTYFKQLIRKDEFKDIVEVRHFEVWEKDSSTYDINNEIASKMYKAMGETTEFSGSVPYIVVGTQAFRGFSTSTKTSIETEIRRAYNDASFVDPVKDIAGDNGELLVVTQSNWVMALIVILIIVALLGGVTFLARRDSLEDVSEKEKKVVKEEKVSEAKVEEVKETPVTKPVKKTTKSTTNKKNTTKKTTRKKTSTKNTKKA